MMAGAFDRETLSFSTADEQAKAAGSRAAAVDAAAQAKEQAAYTAGKSTTGQTLAKQKTTIENLAARANEITDPIKRKAFVESSKIALGDVKLGLELQAIIDKAEFASNIAKDPNNLMNSDSIFTSSAKTGVSNSGKYYVQGKEVSQQEYVNTVGAETGVGSVGGGGGTGGSGAGNLTGTGGLGTPADQAARKSAYDILLEEFNRYGLGALVEPLKGLVMDNVSPSEFSLRLQQTDAYKKRFSANADRIAKGLTALRPAEYLAMEDSYQNIMRNYGLPASYYSKDSLGTQAGFNQLIANDVSATELEDRVMTAQNRVVNANPEVYKALKAFYPDITNGDILAYTLDPTKALDMIKRKVTAAEIGGAALAQGLTTEATTAENLARYGITKQQAQQGYETIGGLLPRASQLADIYKQDPYTQAVAEAEVFGTGGAVNAAERRRKLSALEQAKFAGSSGAAQNALSRDRASSTGVYKSTGAGAF
jgi:hypothetical protein